LDLRPEPLEMHAARSVVQRVLIGMKLPPEVASFRQDEDALLAGHESPGLGAVGAGAATDDGVDAAACVVHDHTTAERSPRLT
jgi:hypothetical protein